MENLKIPHAHKVHVILDPPRQILHVGTPLAESPGGVGFNAEAKQEMMKAIANRVARDGLDGYVVHWSVKT
jgi:hypothetical protein